MRKKGFRLTDEGMMFPVGVPADSIAFEFERDADILAAYDQQVAGLADEIDYVSEYLDYDSTTLSLSDVEFKNGKMTLKVIPSKYSVYRAALCVARRSKVPEVPFLPWSRPNSLGVSVMFVTSDGYALWEVRDSNRFVRGGQFDCSVTSRLYWDGEGGFPTRFLRSAVLSKFEEEVCPVPDGIVPELVIDGLFFDEDYSQWELLGRLSVPVDKEYVEIHYKDRQDQEEVNKLVFMPLKGKDPGLGTGELYGASVMMERAVDSAMSNTRTWKTSLKAKRLVMDRKAPSTKFCRKLFSFDTDGTLTEPPIGSGDISKKAKSAVEALMSRGYAVCLASGRNLDGVQSVAKPLGIDNVVYYGGQGVRCGETMDELSPLDPDLCRELLGECSAAGLPWAVCTRPGKSRRTPYADFEKAADNGFEYTYVEPGMALGDDTPVYAIHILCSEREAAGLESLKALPSYRQSQRMLYVESVSKGDGIARIAEVLGIPKSDVVVFGSGSNDVSALKGPWISIAPSNAVDKAVAAADYITDGIGLNGIWNACSFFGWL